MQKVENFLQQRFVAILTVLLILIILLFLFLSSHNSLQTENKIEVFKEFINRYEYDQAFYVNDYNLISVDHSLIIQVLDSNKPINEEFIRNELNIPKEIEFVIEVPGPALNRENYEVPN